jgi:hypothetical protein
MQSVESMPLLMARARHAGVRWRCLACLYAARPGITTDEALLVAVREVYLDLTPRELRCELEYLAGHQLLEVDEKRSRWRLRLAWRGVDVVEYTSECPSGIGRPQPA